jgi:hypothetical protein
LNSWHQALSDLSVFINKEGGRKIVNMIIYNKTKWWRRWWNVSVTLEKLFESSPLKNFSFLSLKEHIITLDKSRKQMDSKLMVMNYTMNGLYQSVGEEKNETIHINKTEIGSIFAKPALIC